MTMTPAVAIARKRKKRQEAMGTAAMLGAIAAVVMLVSWFEYDMFDAAVEPWIRIVAIALAWVVGIGMVVVAASNAFKAPPPVGGRS